ncbi:hypothetical protein Tco_0428017 [Tanacetum coccineum]
MVLEEHPLGFVEKDFKFEERLVVSFVDVVFDGALRALGEEEVVVGEGVVVTSSSLEMLTNNYLGGMIVNLIFFEGFKEEALVEFMVELVEEDGDDK